MGQRISDNQRAMFDWANAALVYTIQVQRKIFDADWGRALVEVKAAIENLEDLAERIEKERGK